MSRSPVQLDLFIDLLVEAVVNEIQGPRLSDGVCRVVDQLKSDPAGKQLNLNLTEAGNDRPDPVI